MNCDPSRLKPKSNVSGLKRKSVFSLLRLQKQSLEKKEMTLLNLTYT